jgi:predicted AlkP superfamily phosphohydrolase/phosphomutase
VIGPGRAGLVTLLAAAIVACERPPESTGRRLIVLGIDGMDPGLTRRLMAEGKLPRLQALVRNGSLLELATSIPPQSPVAWSHVITGQDSAGHGIYDFVHRDPDELAPYLSTSRVQAGVSLSLGGWRLPLGGDELVLLRGGRSFWSRLAERDVASRVLKIPAHFPPSEDLGSHTLSGMGTPDLLGTYGTFQLFSSDPAQAGRDLPGGLARALQPTGPGRFAGALQGPPHPLRRDRRPLTVPLTVARNGPGTAALVSVGGSRALLRPGEWSPWLPVRFDPGVMASEIGGMVRLFLKALVPQVAVYVSPINLDPTAPAMPLSWPRDWSAQLAAETGPFYTQGMPEDTKALAAGVLSDQDFQAQAELIFEEERRLLAAQLARRDSGLLFHYFSVIDQLSHIYYRALEPDAPPALARHKHVLPRFYARIDQVIGEVRAAAPEATVLVMSDHGFAPYKFKVNLNTWLLREGYLTLQTPPASGQLGHIDWTHTQAYALGLNQVFVNLRGRERQGVVTPEQATSLIERVARRLESWIDPDTGARVVLRTFRPAARHAERAPDLIVGFARGYRSSDLSATGVTEPRAVFPNEDRWSGDHCMDPLVVPGMLASSRPLGARQASLIDLAPTILRHFDLPVPEELQGQSLW